MQKRKILQIYLLKLLSHFHNSDGARAPVELISHLKINSVPCKMDAETSLYLENIEEYVLDEEKVVSRILLE